MKIYRVSDDVLVFISVILSFILDSLVMVRSHGVNLGADLGVDLGAQV